MELRYGHTMDGGEGVEDCVVSFCCSVVGRSNTMTYGVGLCGGCFCFCICFSVQEKSAASMRDTVGAMLAAGVQSLSVHPLVTDEVLLQAHKALDLCLSSAFILGRRYAVMNA